MFPTALNEIQNRIKAIQPEKYGQTRNFSNGAVTKLSPYISRGVISTKQIFEYVLSLDLPFYKIEKLVQELAWRDYWQQIWKHKGDAIFSDFKRPQPNVSNYKTPKAIAEGNTTIEAIDKSINQLYETGYMHNHMRMYVAMLSCNVAQSHWLEPAKWLYANLLDGDLASNHLSWQWVVGANSNKKYYANQDNINKYFYSNQKNTFLDIEYDKFEHLSIPSILTETISLDIKTILPNLKKINLDANKNTLVYNYYNLDPNWRKSENANRILLLEPSFFEKYPVRQKCVDFIFDLSKNIENIQVFCGEFDELQQQVEVTKIIYKEHPTSNHYAGVKDERDWMFTVEGYYPSFFKFWKLCKKELK